MRNYKYSRGCVLGFYFPSKLPMQHSSLFPLDKRSPEQQKALKVLEKNIGLIRTAISLEDLSIDMLTIEDAKHYVTGYVNTPNVPRGAEWIWNQSRGRQIITTHSGLKCEYFKLNTRKSKTSDVTPPLFKLWVFQLHFPKPITFFWCEKGKDPAPIIDHLTTLPTHLLFPCHRTETADFPNLRQYTFPRSPFCSFLQ